MTRSRKVEDFVAKMRVGLLSQKQIDLFIDAVENTDDLQCIFHASVSMQEKGILQKPSLDEVVIMVKEMKGGLRCPL